MIVRFAFSMCIVAAGLSIPAFTGAQELPSVLSDPSNSSMQPDSTSTAESARNSLSLSPDQLIRLLRSNPEMMVEAKSLLGDSIGDSSPDSQPGNPSDDELFSSVLQSPDVRARLTRFLLARGYIDERAANLARSRSSMRSPQQPPDDQLDFTDTLQFPEAAGTSSLQQDGLAARSLRRTRPDASPYSRQVPSSRREDQDSSNITDEPNPLRRPAPYNLRSLRDLYTQVPDAPEHLKRFGSEVFTNRNSETELPVEAMDVPIGPDYVLGSGDELSVAIWGGVSQNLMRAIDREGRITLPEVGPLQVAGLTLSRAEELARQALQPQFRNAQVSLTVARLRTIQIYVVGDVQRPGAYQVSAIASPVTALMAAGGPTARGSLRIVRHLRGRQLIEQIDLYDFLLHGVRPVQDRIQAGDTLLIPPAGPQIAIFGAVKRPAIYELESERTLDTVVADAGGLTVAAELGQVTIERFTNAGRREVNLGSATETADTLQARLSRFEVKDGDRVRVGAALPVSDRVIYLQGHVSRPGKIGYRDGMQIADVIRSYRDLLPEPSDTGELVRLVPPDLHPETIEFKIADALIGNVSLPLQPFDTIRIFGRYEQDAPMVTVRGEVNRPGAYPLFDGMTAAQLVRAAGGFKRAAFLETADLVSYRVEDGSRVSTERKEVPIGAAVLRDDRTADPRLKPGDVLTVHQLTSWNDIGASIVIEGEVAHPGSYGFKDGERLSDVLRRAGGFLPAAYPDGAILTRPEVAKLEEKNRDALIRQIEAGASAARLSPGVAGADKSSALQLIQQQQEQVLSDLRNQPAAGRLVIHIDSHIESWAGTPADIQVRSGDLLRVPKQPAFVLVSGQVYNAAAITFLPGKSAAWYLQHAGGANGIANRKEIFIIRANGSVVGRQSGTWYGNDVLSTRVNPGDTIVVPQKIVGPSLAWRNLLTAAQIAASVAVTVGVVGL